MFFSARQIRIAVDAVQLRATGKVARTSTNLATVRIVAQRAAVALAAALKAPAIELGLQAQLIKASALVGQFLFSLFPRDEVDMSDAMAFRLARQFDDIASASEQIALSTGKTVQDSFSAQEQAIITAVKGLSDAVGLADVRVQLFGKTAQDQAAATDSESFRLSRGISDGFEWYEGPGRAEYAIDYFLEEYAYEGAPALTFIKGAQDASAFTDSSFRRVGKGLNEPLQLSETFARYMTRQIFEGLSVTDDFDGMATAEDDQVMALRKAVTDAAAMTDSFVRVAYFVRQPIDPVGTTDSTVSRFSKGLSDAPSTTDLLRFNLARPLADAFGTSDSARLTASKAASDAFSMTDATVKTAGKAITDPASTTDATAARVAKALADAAAITEQARFALSRTLADAYATTDTTNKNANKGIADVAAATDSGSIRMQSYCDITYFAEDYVGIYTIF